MRLPSLLATLVASSALLATPALAQDAAWVGEGSLGAGMTSGNTDTTDFGMGLKLQRVQAPWTLTVEAIAEYAETNGVESNNRTFLAGQADFDLQDRLYGFVRGSWEQDKFSGYESRAFLGAGLGYHLLKAAPTTWALEVAPGQKFDEVREVILPGPVIIPGYSDNAFSVIGVSRVTHQFNPAVKIANDTFVTWSDLTTQIDNRLAVSAALTGALSARFSFDVRHDTNPPIGFESTDTATRVSLVYAFGQ